MSVELIKELEVKDSSLVFSVQIKPLNIQGTQKNRLDASVNQALAEKVGGLAFKSTHPYLIGLSGQDKDAVSQLSASAIDYLSKNCPLNIPSLSFTRIDQDYMIRIGVLDPPHYAIMAVQDFSTEMPAINTVRDAFFGTFNQFLKTL